MSLDNKLVLCDKIQLETIKYNDGSNISVFGIIVAVVLVVIRMMK